MIQTKHPVIEDVNEAIEMIASENYYCPKEMDNIFHSLLKVWNRKSL